MKRQTARRSAGFTLIELLIVIAIIAILALIAIPNFLEAQTRAKITRVKADMRSAAIAVEAYFVDNNKYPCTLTYGTNWSDYCTWFQYLGPLTTPVAYITTTWFLDPFAPANPYNDANFKGTIRWIDYSEANGKLSWGGSYGSAAGLYGAFTGFCFTSYGPTRQQRTDKKSGEYGIFDITKPIPYPMGPFKNPDAYYDPTNGTISTGYISRYGGGAPDGQRQ
ncbi:MAG: prepilin-type N-terminal cleavage/methylation domain-containing protein [Candidatus Sumerlaeota bacterium]|nr:prepilin-type N-terminal cleavage/methylation domain-containing protein [Candidatus Sumerlaeota bacterium]